MYVLKLALRPWRLAGGSQFMGAFSVAFLLFACTLLVWLERGLGPVIERLQGEQVLTAYLVPTLPAKDEPGVEDSIRVAVGSSAARDVSVRLTTAEEFLAQLKESHPELAEQLAELSDSRQAVAPDSASETSALQGSSNPVIADVVPRFVTVSGLLSSATAQAVKAIPGVESVESSESRYRPVAGAFTTLRWIARLLALGLLVALFNSLIHMARSHAAFHGQTLSILKLWGADSVRAQLPCAISGFTVGVLGGGLATIAWFVVADSLRIKAIALSPAFEALPSSAAVYAVLPMMAGALFGIACGFLGSIPARRRS